MIADEEVQRLFRDMFTARRVILQRQEDLRLAKSVVSTAESDLEAANARLVDLERTMQRLVERAAGVSAIETDRESAPQMHSEFRPVRR